MLDTGLSSTAACEDCTGLDSRKFETRSTEELEEEIAELCAHIDAATYRLLRAIAEFDRREAWGVGFTSTAHWLTWKVGIDMVTAREKVRVAWTLEDLPLISEAFLQGRMSYSKVRAMTRIATPENESYLLYIAENGTTDHVERVVRGYRRATRGAAGLEEARRQREVRYPEMYTDDDGMVVIRGRLPQEVAALLEKTLQAAMNALEEEGKKEAKDGVDPDEDSVGHDSAESSAVWGQADANDSAEIPEASGECDVDASAEVSGAFKQGDADDSAESSEGSITTQAGGLPPRSRCSGFAGPQLARATEGNDSAECWCRESLAPRRPWARDWGRPSEGSPIRS